jgi:hypothetical protein
LADTLLSVEGQAMPLQDHLHPPLSQRRHWEGLHSAWANALATQLNLGLLPARFFAEPHITVGPRVEVDVTTWDEGGVASAPDNGAVAVWAPPKPAVQTTLDFADLDLFEVQVLSEEEGPRVVAAVELVSPANKDRASHGRQFAIKCGNYLQQGISVIVIDVVTTRSGNLHRDLLDLLGVAVPTPIAGLSHLYAAAHRAVPTGEAQRLEVWCEALAVGASLPTLPLWLLPDLAVPLNFEEAYRTACQSLRIE